MISRATQSFNLQSNRLLKNNFRVILNGVKDLSSAWKCEILRCAQNDADEL
jgi:hypothetical protein